MKKKLVTKVMAFFMAILCLVGTMPITSVKAEEQQLTGKEKLSELVDIMDGIMNDTVVASETKSLKLFTGYTDSTRYDIMEEQLKKQKDILSLDATEAEYQAAYEAFYAECEFFFEGWSIKTPDKNVLRELINNAKTYLKNVDESGNFEDVEPGMVWVKPSALEALKTSLEVAEDIYNTYLEADEQNYDVYTKIYNACVALEASLDEVKEDGNSEVKPCTLQDVKNMLDSLKKIENDVPYYDTKEQAAEAGVEYYILTENKNKFDDEIKAVEEKISNESEMGEGMCLITYNYAKRAARKFVKNIVIVDNNKSENVTKEYLDDLLGMCDLATDEKYLATVQSKYEARYGEAYALVEYVEAYKAEVKNIREEAAKDGADYSELLNKLQAALNELRNHIEYKETTMEDLNEALYYADVFKSQLKTAASDDDIILNGVKGVQYVLESDMEAFDKKIAWDEKEKEGIADSSDVILNEYYILALVQDVNRAMSELSGKVRIANADNTALESLIGLAEDFTESIYKADSFDKVPEGRYWISPTALDYVNEQIAKAKAALATDNISEKNDAYNALSTAFVKAKSMVKQSKADVTPGDDTPGNGNTSEDNKPGNGNTSADNTNNNGNISANDTTDNGTVNNTATETAKEAVNAPKTGDASGVYVYVLVAALSAAVLSAAGYKKIRR